jgi:integrase/recombinase XerD
MDNTTLVAIEKDTQDKDCMLEPYFEKFNRHMLVLRGLSPKTIISYVAEIKKFYGWKQNKQGSSSIAFTREDVEAYIEHCYFAGNGNLTRNTKLTAIKKFNRFLIYERYLSEDVTIEIPRSKTARGFPHTFSKGEILRLFSVIDIRMEKGLRDAVIFITAAFLGLRIGEIVKLNVGDVIEMEGATSGGLAFQVLDSKFKSSRMVHLWKVPSMLVKQLLILRSSQGAQIADPLIVTYTNHGRVTGNRISKDTITYTLKAYARKAGIKKTVIRMHMFRASHATALRSIANYDLPSIASRLGHKSIATTADKYFSSWERVRTRYPSLAVYWKEFNKLFSEDTR